MCDCLSQCHFRRGQDSSQGAGDSASSTEMLLEAAVQPATIDHEAPGRLKCSPPIVGTYSELIQPHMWQHRELDDEATNNGAR